MYLIIGLGNPEEDYKNTRHNMGFDTINKLATSYKIEINKKKFKALIRLRNNRKSKSIISKTSNLYELEW